MSAHRPHRHLRLAFRKANYRVRRYFAVVKEETWGPAHWQWRSW